MASVGTVVIEIDADVAKFVEGVKRTNRNISALEKRVYEAKKSLSNFATATVGILAVAGAFEKAKEMAKDFLKTASEFEQYNNRLSAFYKGTNAVNKEIDRAIAFSTKYNVQINDTMDALIKMKVYGIEPTNKTLEIFGNTAVGGGKSLDQFVEAMADAFQGENERLKEFGVKASVEGDKVAYAWSDSSGKARSVVIDNNKKIIQSTLETIFNEKYVGQMELRANSWAGFVDSVSNQYTLFKKQVMDEGLFVYFKSVAEVFRDYFTKAFGDSKEGAKAFAETTKEYLAGLAMAVGYFIDSWRGVSLVWNTLKYSFSSLVLFIGEGINSMGKWWHKITEDMANVWYMFVDGISDQWHKTTEFLGIESEGAYKSAKRVHTEYKDIINLDWTKINLNEEINNIRDNWKALTENSAVEKIPKALDAITIKEKKVSKEVKKTSFAIEEKTKKAKEAMAQLLQNNSGTIKQLQDKKKAEEALAKAKTKAQKEADKAQKEAIKRAKEELKLQLQQQKEQERAYKEYLQITGQKQKLFDMETKEILERFEKLSYSEEKLAEIENARATEWEKQSKQKQENLKKEIDLKKDFLDILKQEAIYAGQNILADYAQTGDMGGAIDNFTDSNALRDGLKNSGNPYAMAVGYGAEIISGALTEPLDDFQKMQSNIHHNNKSIMKSMDIVANAQYPYLEVAKKSEEHLRNIQSSLVGVSRTLVFSDAGRFAMGKDFDATNDTFANDKFKSFIGDLDEFVGLGFLNKDWGNFLNNFSTGFMDSVIGSSKTELTQAGIVFGEQTVGAFIDGLDAQAYQIVETKSKHLFGLIKSSSSRTEYQELDDDVKKAFVDTMDSGRQLVAEQMDSLGISISVGSGKVFGLIQDETVSGYEALYQAIGDNTKIEQLKEDFKDKSEAEVNEILSGYFGNAFGEMVAQNTNELDRFKNTSEELNVTLARVSVGVESANYNISRLGFDEIDFSKFANNDAIENLNADTSTFINSFYTDAEKFNIAMMDMTHVTDSLNLTLPNTEQGFKDLVLGLDLTTTEGQQAYSALNSVSGAMADMYSQAQAIVSQQISDYRGIHGSIESIEKEIESARSSSMQSQVDTANYFAEHAQKVADSTKKMFDTNIKAFDNSIRKIKGYDDTNTAEGRFQSLVRFNELEAKYRKMASGSTVDANALATVRQDLLSVAGSLGQSDLSGLEFKDALANSLTVDRDMLTAKAFVAQDNYPQAQRIADDSRLKELQSSLAELKWLKSLMEDDRSVYFTKRDFARTFSTEHDLSMEQSRALWRVTEDGDLTIQEIEELRNSTAHFSEAQISALYSTANLDVTNTDRIVEAINGLDIRITNVTYTQDNNAYQTDDGGWLLPPQTTDKWQDTVEYTSYAGGGYTGNGSRTGGVDGLGGEFSIIHPQEIVLDLLKLPKIPRAGNNNKEIVDELKKMNRRLESIETRNKQLTELNSKALKESEKQTSIANSQLVVSVGELQI